MNNLTITTADTRLTTDLARARQAQADASRATQPAGGKDKAAPVGSSNRASALSVFGDPTQLHSASPDELLNQFQNILLGEMLKAMRESVMKEDLFGDNSARETFESLLDQEYVNLAGAKGGALGLTEVLKIQLGLAERPGPLNPDLLELPELPAGHSETVVPAQTAPVQPEVH